MLGQELGVALVGGVDEELGFFGELVGGALGVARVGVFVAVEKVVGELAVVVFVPEEFRFDEAGAEFVDDCVNSGVFDD